MKKLMFMYIISLIMFSNTIWAESAQDAQKHFLQAKGLIKRNSADSYRATKGGLENGIAELRVAIQSGYENKKEAYELLRDAYTTLAIVHSVPDSKEQKDLFSEIKKINQLLVQIDPNDPKILYEYTIYLDDEDIKYKTYQKIVKINPDHVDARFAMSKILMGRGKYKEGKVELQEVLKRAKGDVLHNYQVRGIELLEEHGLKEEAKEIKKQLKEERR